MSTPNMRASSIEANSPSSDPAASASGEATPVGAGAPKGDPAVNNWLNLALFSIGGVAAIGLVVILFGAYLLKPANTGVIVSGAIILMLAIIAWIFAALTMIGNLLWKIINSRGNKPRKSPPR